MAIIKKRTNKGTFYIEFGSIKEKAPQQEGLDEYLNRITPPNKKVEEAYQIFLNYNLNNGYKKRELRLDRTFIEFGRRKS